MVRGDVAREIARHLGSAVENEQILLKIADIHKPKNTLGGLECLKGTGEFWGLLFLQVGGLAKVNRGNFVILRQHGPRVERDGQSSLVRPMHSVRQLPARELAARQHDVVVCRGDTSAIRIKIISVQSVRTSRRFTVGKFGFALQRCGEVGVMMGLMMRIILMTNLN